MTKDNLIDTLQKGYIASSGREAELREALSNLSKVAIEFMEYAESGWDFIPDVSVKLRLALQGAK